MPPEGSPIDAPGARNELADPPPSAPPSDGLQRPEVFLLLILAAVQFISIVDFMVVMPLAAQLERRLHLNTSQFGLIVSAYTLSAGFAAVLASAILDRYDRKRAFLVLFAGFLLGTLCCGLSGSYATLMLARIVTGAFGGILGGMALAIVGDVFPDSRRGRATGVLMSAFALASVLGVPICLDLGNRFGWQFPFLALAALGVPILALAARQLPSMRGHMAGQGRPDPLRQILETFNEPNHVRAFAFTFTLMVGAFLVIPYMSLYLVKNVGITESQLTWVYFTGGVLSLFGAPISGRLADRLGKPLVYRAMGLAVAVMMLLITNMPRVSLALAAGCAGLFMFFNSGRMVAGMAIVTGSVEPRRRGGFMSANSAVQHLGAGIGAWLGGLITGPGPNESITRYNLVGLLGILATMMTLWLVGRITVLADFSPGPVIAGTDRAAGSPAVRRDGREYSAPGSE
ncbi:MFS transporter [Aquisphaera insulae]|uniref:MFS transporter n=1 Tax=Aquisphaera insulae TaxID=2712864 RepID=UPI0013E9A95F|nr:MFS transporter [Aquisphaera insulae]